MADNVAETPVSLRLPSELTEAYQKIADAIDRKRSWVMHRALRQYLDNGEGAGILQDIRGLAALDRGEGVDFDDAMDEIDGIIAEAKASQSARKAG